MLTRTKKRLSRFKGEERGSATIEAVVWLPLFFLFLVAAADASFIFFGQNQAYRAVQDANRHRSVGRLATDAETEAEILAKLASIAPNAVAHSEVSATGVVRSWVEIPASDLVAVGVITALADATIYAESSHLIEF